MARAITTIMQDIERARTEADRAGDIVRSVADLDDPTDRDLDRQAAALADADASDVEVRRFREELEEAVAAGQGGRERGYGEAPTLRRNTGDPDRDEAYRTIERSNRAGLLPDHGAEKATGLIEQVRAPEEAGLAARWISRAGSEAYARAFAKLAADPTRGHLMWDAEEAEAYRLAAGVQAEINRAAMSLTDANGGYLVPTHLDPTILLTSAGSINPLRRISRVVQVASDQWNGINSAGVTAEWKAEAAESSDAGPTVGPIAIPVYFGDAFVPYSFEIGMDGAGFLRELGTLLADAADQLQATAYTTGSGTGQPTGLVTKLGATAGSRVAGVGTEALAAADAFNVQNALPARFSANAQWMAHLATINTFRQFETTAGALKFPELTNGQLLNRAMNENSNMDGTINPAAAENNDLLVYGDFRQFVIVDRIGTQVEFIQNLVGANRRPTGQRGALMWFRTGSDVAVTNAFRVLRVVTT